MSAGNTERPDDARGYRPEWWPENGSLLAMAEQLHGVFTGSVDPNDSKDQMAAKCLRWALDHWKTPECEFDVMVRILCGRALIEYGQHVAYFEKVARQGEVTL
jgi:hypothetical protein